MGPPGDRWPSGAAAGGQAGHLGVQNGLQPCSKSRASPQKDSGACAGEPTPARIWKQSHGGL